MYLMELKNIGVFKFLFTSYSTNKKHFLKEKQEGYELSNSSDKALVCDGLNPL